MILFFRSREVSAVQSTKKLTWLIFILGKVKILRCTDDITDMAFLLFACLYHAIILIPADVQCDLIDSKYRLEFSVAYMVY